MSLIGETTHVLVVDEADLLLSYGYCDDLIAIGSVIPRAVQTLLLSATITPDLDVVKSLFLHNPVTIDCAEKEVCSATNGNLKQYWLRCSQDDKFLIIYALFNIIFIKSS